jgi:hypothetical protein
MPPPLIQHYLVAEIRLGKACDSYLPTYHLCLGHYPHYTHTSYQTHTRLLVGKVQVESDGARDAPRSNLL